MSLYDAGTLVQLLVALAAFFIAWRARLDVGLIGAVGRVAFFVGLALNEIWWTIARETFAGAEWARALFAAWGIDGKLLFETSPMVLVFKLLMLAGLLVLCAESSRRVDGA